MTETGSYMDSVGLFFAILKGKLTVSVLLCPLQKMRQIIER